MATFSNGGSNVNNGNTSLVSAINTGVPFSNGCEQTQPIVVAAPVVQQTCQIPQVNSARTDVGLFSAQEQCIWDDTFVNNSTSAIRTAVFGLSYMSAQSNPGYGAAFGIPTNSMDFPVDDSLSDDFSEFVTDKPNPKLFAFDNLLDGHSIIAGALRVSVTAPNAADATAADAIIRAQLNTRLRIVSTTLNADLCSSRGSFFWCPPCPVQNSFTDNQRQYNPVGCGFGLGPLNGIALDIVPGAQVEAELCILAFASVEEFTDCTNGSAYALNGQRSIVTNF